MSCALDRTKVLIFSGFYQYECYTGRNDSSAHFEIEPKERERIELTEDPLIFYEMNRLFAVQNGFA